MTSWPPGILLADKATTADRPGNCTLCPHPIFRGQRAARLVDGTGWAHVSCVAALKPGTPG
jgi:hypothetical protein